MRKFLRTAACPCFTSEDQSEPEPKPEPTLLAEPEPTPATDPVPTLVAEPEETIIAEPTLLAEPEPTPATDPVPTLVAEPIVAEPEHPLSAEHPMVAAILASLARNEQRTNIAASLARREEELAAIPHDDSRRPSKHFSLALEHSHHYNTFNILDNLQASIHHFEQALETAPEHFPQLYMIHTHLGGAVMQRYAVLGSPSDVDKALECVRAAVAESTGDDRLMSLYQVSLILKDRYKLFGEPGDLDAAIENSEAALQLMPAEHAHRAQVLYDLADHFFARYLNLDGKSDLDEAIRCTELTLVEPLDDDDDMSDPGSVNESLSIYLDCRYDGFNDLEDLHKAVTHAGQALTMAPEGHPKRCNRLYRLSCLFRKAYIRLQLLTYLDESIFCARAALVCPGNNSDQVEILSLLSVSIMTRYQTLQDLDDLQEAIVCAKALIAVPDTALMRGGRLNHLSELLRTRFARLAYPSDAETAAEYVHIAIENCEEALLVVPRNSPDRISLLNQLSNQYYNRSERPGGPLSDLEKAILYSEEVLAMERQDSLTETLINLAQYFLVRFYRLGLLDDLEKAIQHAEKFLAAHPADGQGSTQKEYRASTLHILSTSLNARYGRLGALSDHQAAVKHAKASVEDTSATSTNRGKRLRNLSKLLSFRYHKLRVNDDLSEVIACTEEALAETSVYDFNYPVILQTLAFNLRHRYDAHENVEDINAAVTHARRALTFSPVGHMDHRAHVCDLGNILRTRYPASGNLNDLDEAVELGQEAVTGLPTDHFDRLNLFSLAAYAYRDRYKATGSDEDRKLSYSHLLEAYHSTTGTPLNRVIIAREIIVQFQSLQTWEESSSLLESALLLVPKISLPFLGREDLQHVLSKLNGLPSDAAAYALQAGKEASHGLQLLELGRGIIASFGMDARSELSELEVTHPALFHSFTTLRAVMNPTEEEPLDKADTGIYKSNIHFSSKLMQATLDMEPLLSEIRKIPAYERFLLPPAPADLMKTAEGGTIVVVNTTSLRSDAIIVTSSAITGLALPDLTYEEAKERLHEISQLLVKGPRSTYPERSNKMIKLLAWLWDVVVEPVLSELQPNGVVPGVDLTRVWWIGVGVLGTAPFHAAGRDHSAGSTSNTLNRILSSYIPTIKGLSYARQKPLNLVSKPDSQLLLVSMPTTPGGASLLGVEQEVKEIVAILAASGRAQTTSLTQPSSATVLAHLQHYDAVHFACHGLSDPINPSNSSLLLFNQSVVDPLTAHMISRSHSKKAQIAYLSACSTAANTATKLADETIHLASAFQLAGFNHVLATMWLSNDAACVAVAKVFYAALFDGLLDPCDGHRKVSVALHQATKRLRDSAPQRPLVWAPFIHTGA